MKYLINPKSFILGSLFGVILLISGFSFFMLVHKNKIIPGVFIDSVDVSGLTQQEAIQKVKEQTTNTFTLTFEDESKQFSISTSSASLGLTRDIETAVEKAYAVGRSNSFLTNISDVFLSKTHPQHIQSMFSHNLIAIQEFTQSLSENIDVPGKEPSAILNISGNSNSITIEKGKIGRELDQNKLNTLLASIQNGENRTEILPIASTSSVLTDEETILALERAKKVVKKSININGPADTKETINDKTIVSLLSFPNGYNDQRMQTEIATLSAKINRPPKNAELEISNGKVTHFVAPETGRGINIAALQRSIISALQHLENSDDISTTIDAEVETTQPEITLDKLNTQGLKERIGVSESFFFHSIPNRVFNVNLTSSHLNLALIPSGKDISFNDIVGEISAKTGYKPAYVISQGKTVLGDGGGVCQVSSTLFRAALNAGLPIVERKGHSYRVGYYEQNSKPGFDATVYAPTTNLRIKNDTPGSILISAQVWPKEYRMQIELWGTSDGRVTTISDIKLWDQIPPLPTIYQDDPTLPAGTIKQVDWAAWGAKASFKYTVTRKNEDGSEDVLQDRIFKTVYQPWANVYLRGIL